MNAVSWCGRAAAVFGLASTCAVPRTTMAAPMPAPAVVPAGGQSCIVTNRVIDKKGLYDSSRVEMTNRCGQPVSAYVCVVAVYQRDARAPCDPRFGGYSGMQWAPGQKTVSSIPSTAQAVVTIRECPTGYRLGSGDVSSFPCVR